MSDRARVYYTHTQRSYWLSVGTGLVLLATASLQHQKPIPLLMMAIGVPLLGAIFGSLTIRIQGTELVWYFGPGLVKRRKKLSDIVTFETTRTRWYEGLGVHRTRRGWLYNLMGFDAIRISLKDGKAIMLGTDDQRRLASALRSAARLK